MIECKTYRTRPHAEGMGDYTYRTRDEVEEWKTRCPIDRLRKVIVESDVADEAEVAPIVAVAEAGVDAEAEADEEAARGRRTRR